MSAGSRKAAQTDSQGSQVSWNMNLFELPHAVTRSPDRRLVI